MLAGSHRRIWRKDGHHLRINRENSQTNKKKKPKKEDIYLFTIPKCEVSLIFSAELVLIPLGINNDH